MPASREDIRRWLQHAQSGGARWLVVKCDSFDYHGSPSDRCCYPVALNQAHEVWKTIDNADRTMEVYDLELSIDDQLREFRAFHPPKREEA